MRFRQWLVDRFGLRPIWKGTLDRRVPKAPWYYGDGMSLLILLGILVITGMAMTLTYSPSPDGAFDSVVFITDVQFLGWFVRALHYWAAGMMVVMVVFHLLRVILVGGYKLPREGTWLIGVGLLLFVTIMAFTGYVLRWDERGLFALKVALHHFNNVPLIGPYLVTFVQGGSELGSQALTRIYAVHVVILPLLILGLTGYHVYLVIIKGITSSAEREQPVHSVEEQKALYKAEAESERGGETFFPFTVISSGRLAMLVLAITFLLAIFAGPAPLYSEANLTDSPLPMEEWWFWWYSALAALLPSWMAPAFYVLFPFLLFGGLAMLPFLDRNPRRGFRGRPIVVTSVAIVAVALLGLTNLRYFSPWTGWPSDDPPPVPPGIELSPEAEEGRHLFATFGCNACHAVAGEGPRVAIDIARIEPRLSIDALREVVLTPPPEYAMPAYEGRLTDDELQAIVEFVLVGQTFPRK
jgi:ubiquinol-cytochrome c reductase cytochrome b subunit